MSRNWTTTEIIDAVKSNDKEQSDLALKHVYKAHFGSIRSYILSNSGTEEDAADVFQDALIVWYDMVRSEKFRTQSTIKTFLYAVARNIWLKQLRNTPKKETMSINMEPTISKSIENDVQGELTSLRLLNEVMKDLGDSCRELLISFYFKKASMKDIMTKFGLSSERSAKTKKYRCMQKLIKLFETRGITKAQILD